MGPSERPSRRPPARRAALPTVALLALVLAALLLASPAAAETVQAVAKQPLENPLPIAPGGRAEVVWDVVNQGDANVTVTVHALAPEGWNVSVLPEGFSVPPQAEGAVRSFTLGVVAPERARPEVLRVTVVLGVVAGNATETQELVARFQVTERGAVLGLFANPLPPPLDNVYGVFLLELGFWALVAAVFIGVQDPLVRFLTRRGEKHTGARVAALVRVPVFALLVIQGVRNAWSALPPGPLVDVGDKVLYAVVVMLGAYVAYRVLRAVLLYYAVNIAAKTETQLDDVLVPVLEKVGGVVIVVLALLTLAGALGLDLSGFVVGGTVASLVVAFAAQDSLSNFFASLFLLADRPFAVGEEIIVIGVGIDENVYRVERIGLRSTRLYDVRSHQVLTLPNNKLASQPVINVDAPDRRFRIAVRVGVGYDSDPAVVERLLLEAARAHPEALESPQPVAARLSDFGDSALLYDVLFYVRDADQRVATASDVRVSILQALRQHGIDIPFPQRVVHVVGPPTGEGPAAGSPDPREGAGASAGSPGRPSGPSAGPTPSGPRRAGGS